MFNAEEVVGDMVSVMRSAPPEVVTALAMAANPDVSVDDSLMALSAVDNAEHRASIKNTLICAHAKLTALLEKMA